MIVIDASLAVKWYLLEAQTYEALALLAEREGDIAVPDVFLAEVTGALVRCANVDKTKRLDSEAAIARFMALFEAGSLTSIRSGPETIASAARIALDLGHPIKDCIYLTLAMERECALVTADARFADKAREVWKGVALLGE